METFEVVKCVPVLGNTESPAIHPNTTYIVVHIVGTGSNARKIQFIDKKTLNAVRTLTVAGTLGHSRFPEYTARGDYLYVSSGVCGDRLVIYDSHSLKKVKTE